jgi:leucyl aminopeptidase (aminopeptidase T)
MIHDAELLEGARNAIRVCMNVQPGERVLIATDRATLSVGDALLCEAAEAGAVAELFQMEEYGERPFSDLPPAIEERMLSFRPAVTYLAVTAVPGEVNMRGQFAEAALRKVGARHAHMPTITPALMREGMRVDYRKVHRLTTAVHDRLRRARRIHVRSARGSDLLGTFSDRLKWILFGGLYHRAGEWGNLPEGEVFTCPESVDGVLMADVIGDYFSPKYGVLESPVRIEIEQGIARRVACASGELQKDLETYLDANENARRVGEFAIGTNIGIRALRGLMLQDEKIPGLHLALGDPYQHLTGADWACRTHVDFVPSRCTITVDDMPLMEDGVFLLDA